MSIPSEKKVLIVESHPKMAQMLESHYESLSLKTLTAMSGLGALKKADEHRPDLILLDTSLSDMEGTEVAAGIREKWKTHRIPILAVSGFSFLKATYLGSGCNAFLAKPFTADELVSSIKRLLKLNDASVQINLGAC
jgi:two-component system, OmpR family, KDP operon response regulator KdpE